VVIHCEGERTGEEEMVIMFGKVLWYCGNEENHEKLKTFWLLSTSRIHIRHVTTFK